MIEPILYLKRHLTSFQIMILGFAGVILLGALVLMLPIATVQRIWTPFHEALFTSTSAVCVTGLVVQDTGSYWSTFGQTVILLLIQIGGLGVITGAVTFLMLAGRNITLKERSAMQDAISAPAVGGIVRLTRFILETSHKLFSNNLLDYLHEILVGYRYYSHHKCPHIHAAHSQNNHYS